MFEVAMSAKTMTKDRWWELRAKTNCGMQCQPHEMREALDCITPVEDQKPNPDDALLLALGNVPGGARNAEDHYFCPDCGPFAGVDEDGCCHHCGATVRDVNPGKETK